MNKMNIVVAEISAKVTVNTTLKTTINPTCSKTLNTASFNVGYSTPESL